MSLVQYRTKRDFSRTREPAGQDEAQGSARRLRRRFVVQKHAASRLHYDFRLEMEGVLKSWAVPKGFPCTKGDKRLAMEVEDHPLEYGGFEGTIPAGNYGAGTVMLWDHGPYQVPDHDPLAALQQGKLALLLTGRKLKGHWTLVRMRPGEGTEKNAWLLIKTEESTREISPRLDDRSVKSGRTMRQIATTVRKSWPSRRPKAASKVPTRRPAH